MKNLGAASAIDEVKVNHRFKDLVISTAEVASKQCLRE